MKKQSGFTLIEFMVAMAVSIIVLGATMLAFRDATKTNQKVTLQSDMTDNLRAAMNMIQQDLILTGTGIPTGGISVPNTGTSGSGCTAGVSVINRPALNAQTFPICNVVLPALNPGSSLGVFVTSPDATSTLPTDIISMMYADNSPTNSNGVNVGMDATPINGTGCPNGKLAANGTSITFDTSCFDPTTLATSGVPISSGDLIVLSNANGNSIQTVTGISGAQLNFAAGDAFKFNGTGLPSGTMIQLQNYNLDSSGNKVFNVGTYPPTTATRVWMISYYLDNTADSTDPNRVRLIRRVNFNTGQPVAETIENLQFTYNFLNGSSVSANQSSVPTGYSENQIRNVTVYLGARSDTPTTANNKVSFMRTSLQSQVTIRGLAYFNQYK